MKEKKKVTKWQRKKRRLRKIKEEYGVGQLYFDMARDFAWLSIPYTVECSKINLFKEQCLSPTQLIDIMNLTENGKYLVHYVDDDMRFDTLNDLKEYLMIKRLAGI